MNQLAFEYRQREDLFQLLVSNAKDYAIFVVDPNGYVMTWNEGACRANGYNADEIVGQHFSVFYTAESSAADDPARELEQAKENGRFENEGWRIRKNHSRFWASVVITPLYDVQNLIGFALVTRDLTERKHIEHEREDARMLAQTNEELQRLAYVVSHELQGPISTIPRYLNLLAARYQDRLGDDADDFIAKIADSSKTIGRMIDDLWTFARVGKPNLRQEFVYMPNLMTEMIGDLKDSLKGSEVTFGELPSIFANRESLIYLFKELIGNAITYRASAPPSIRVEAQPDSNGWLFSVKDNGIGIDHIYGNDVFKLFNRFKGFPEATGTGMGLAICKKIVRQHNGRIWFESPGEGTTFFIWLPSR